MPDPVNSIVPDRSRARRVGTFALGVFAEVVALSAIGCERGAGDKGAGSAAPASAAAPAAAVQPGTPAQPQPAAPSAAANSGGQNPPSPSPAPASADAAAGDSIDGPPPVRLEPEIMDFGILPPSIIKEGSIKLYNTGTKELEVLTAQPSCKCTTTDDISGKKIPVGGFVELKASMKAQSAPGKKSAEIKVLIDGYTQVIPIQLKSEVSLPVRVSPSYLNVVKGQPMKGRTVIESIDKKPFKVCAVGGKKPNLVGFDPEKDEPRSQYLLDWDFDRDFAPGEAKRYWIIETDREDCPLVDIFVRHESTIVLPRMKFTEYRHTFGRVDQGTPFEWTVDVSELGADEKVVTVASGSSQAKVELLGTTREGDITHIKLKLVPNADTIGLTWVPFTVYTNSRQQEQAVWGQYVPKGVKGCYGH